MKKIAITIAILCAMGSIACTSDTVAPEWRIEGPRVLAIAADKPVFSPDDTVEFSLLLAGLDMVGRTGATVEWRLGNLLQSLPVDRFARFTIPAAADVDIYFGADTDYRYVTAGSAAVEVSATVRLADGTILPARKSVLLAKPSVAASLAYKTPEIVRIAVEIPGHSFDPVDAGDPIFLPAGTEAKTIKLQAEMAENVGYGYRWFVESSNADVHPIIKTGSDAQKVEISLPQLGVLMVSLVVEDRTEESKETLYAGGLDFVSFTVGFGSDTTDEDSVTPDYAVDAVPTEADTLLAD